jgi:acetyl esterase
MTRPRLDPFVAAIAQRLDDRVNSLHPDSAGGRRARIDPVARREAMRDRDGTITEELGVDASVVSTRDHRVPVPGHPDARLRVYWPREQASDPPPEAGLPILVYFFGGSFAMGGIDWAGVDLVCRTRAGDAGVIVIAGEYSLAPEVTYPTQPEQCWCVFEWAVAHAAEIGGDARRVAIGGASAGGNLAAVVSLMNRDRSGHPVRLQLLEVPVLDLTGKHLDPRALSPFLPAAVLRRIARPVVLDYLGRRHAGARAREPYASPLRAESLRDLPAALILTAEADPLRGDGEAYARALAAAGVPATCVRYVGQDHGSAGLRHLNPAADHVHRQIIATLRTLHEPARRYGPIDAERSRS